MPSVANTLRMGARTISENSDSALLIMSGEEQTSDFQRAPHLARSVFYRDKQRARRARPLTTAQADAAPHSRRKEMAKKQPHIIADIVKEVEATAKRIRTDVRRMGKDAQVGRGLARLAADLRSGAAHVGKQIDRYVREVKAEVKATAKSKKKATKKRATKKKVARKRVAKKTTRKRSAR